MSEQGYINYVLGLDREHVTDIYAELYRGAADIVWPYEDSEGTLKPGVIEGEPILLSDEEVTSYAEQDYHDGPKAWAFDEYQEGEA